MSAATELTNKVIDLIYRFNGYAWRAESSGIFDKNLGGYRTAPKKGVADVLACYRGRLIAVEIKIGKDSLSDEQDGFLKNIIAAGGLAVVAKDFEEFTKWWIEKVVHS